MMPRYKRKAGAYTVDGVPAKRSRITTMIVRPTSVARFRGRRGMNRRTGGFLGIETKFYDQSLVGHAILAPTGSTGGLANPSATISLNTVIQGDGESNRDGRKINMKSLEINGIVQVAAQAAATSADIATYVYVAVVHDRQCNGAILVSQNVYANPSGNAALAAGPFRNLQFQSRFRVLKYKRIKLPMQQTAGISSSMEIAGFQVPFHFKVNLKGMPVIYSNTTEAIANTTDNSLSIVTFCSNTNVAPALSYNSRLLFVG